jgi:sulfite reductase (NADPH) flavoprotein alpha-component
LTRVTSRESSAPGHPAAPRDSSQPRVSGRNSSARVRQAWFQVHWIIGITAGTLLTVIGLSGATLSFREEILDALNPGRRQVAPQTAEPLQPQQVLDVVHRSFGDRPVATMTLFSNTGQATRITFAPREGERRGDTVYLDPYSGSALPPAQGAGFFEWVESLHRWLLLPSAAGRIVAGILASLLLTLALTGIYLRWPKRPRLAYLRYRAHWTIIPAWSAFGDRKRCALPLPRFDVHRYLLVI